MGYLARRFAVSLQHLGNGQQNQGPRSYEDLVTLHGFFEQTLHGGELWSGHLSLAEGSGLLLLHNYIISSLHHHPDAEG